MADKYHLPYTAVFSENFDGNRVSQPIVFLHGYSSNMISRADVASFLDNPNFCYFFINAPNRLLDDSELPSFRWYEYQDDDYQHELYETTKKLEKTIDYLCEKYQINESEIILAGFSQGGMMAIHVALNTGRIFKAVAAFSALIESKPITPVSPVNFFISQGLEDPIFPPKFGEYTRDVLTRAGHTVTYNEYDMAHEIVKECLEDFSNWISTLS